MDVYLNVVCCYCCLLFYYGNSNKKELQQITVNHSEILTLKTLRIFTKNVMQNHILL